jgi:RES domain-containing protein
LILYRICLERWSHDLSASGNAGRWNSKGKFVIYTAGSRALACLENIVHRSGEGNDDNYKILLIEVPDTTLITEIKKESLQKNWNDYTNYNYCRKFGDEWLSENSTLILKVPSAIIPEENNYLINPNHKDFKRVKIIRTDNFAFDKRLKK